MLVEWVNEVICLGGTRNGTEQKFQLPTFLSAICHMPQIKIMEKSVLTWRYTLICPSARGARLHGVTWQTILRSAISHQCHKFESRMNDMSCPCASSASSALGHKLTGWIPAISDIMPQI
ncbi:MAG: hypothetical protein EZS28_040218 [Streblomastix strix]|uniref:Uncharacterized protein n=1 Tax=Streblomastix strix TaxID=222440 RepID=A0A5J4U3N6_9EUKA|nr:MAG: hypothetical protein EZS28_040218 [Streblomastix strix]